MNWRFYKSLDRPVNIFGLKGKWITIFLVSVVTGIVIAFCLGGVGIEGLGFGFALVWGIASFFTCYVVQKKYSSRQIEKLLTSGDVRSVVYKRETLSRILLDDPDFLKSRPKSEEL